MNSEFIALLFIFPRSFIMTSRKLESLFANVSKLKAAQPVLALSIVRLADFLWLISANPNNEFTKMDTSRCSTGTSSRETWLN